MSALTLTPALHTSRKTAPLGTNDENISNYKTPALTPNFQFQ